MSLKCFVIMPYAEDFISVYEEVRRAAQDAMQGEQTICIQLSHVQAAGRLTDDLVASPREAAFCIADATGNNPNVMWETG